MGRGYVVLGVCRASGAARLFAGPHHAPTLEGQCVLKDIILVAAGLVIAAGTFRGGRLVRSDLPPTIATRGETATVIDPEHRLRIVLDGINDETLIGELCERNQITEAQFYEWRESALGGAAQALSTAAPVGA